MSILRVSPEEALRLLQDEGYTYLDVRSIPEFEDGHPEGAYNVPFMHMTPAGMEANGDFLAVAQQVFPEHTKLVVGCKSGGRSLRAAEQLVHAGFAHVVDQKAGWAGQTDQFGRIAEEGWGPKGLPASKETPHGHGYAELLKKAYGG